ncbi:MAG TPA: LuxR C-terminal-related transcriptional regulator [Clostridia bacterium]|nr:LuxR C-terminal-related transcriptional regulator [Clostridia bacterium]
MRHIEIMIHVLTLISGITAALLGFLLFMKYRIKEIRYYSVFILTTTFTVTFTTLYNYISYNMDMERYLSLQIAAFIIFEILILLINYAFSLFAFGIINKSFTFINKLLIGIPCLSILISLLMLFFVRAGRYISILQSIYIYSFMIILFSLFLTFIFCSIQIAMNLKNIANKDLKKALKVLALLLIAYIPVQSLIVALNKQWIVIMLSRNLLYLSINIISIVFAARYFFAGTPSIMEHIEVSECFVNKYAITNREKEVIELLLSGLSIKEISARLDRSFKTINNHIYNIYKKTNVSSKMELLNLVKENNL